MLLHGSYDFSHIKRQKISIVTRLLVKAMDDKEEKRAWDMWLTLYPHMTKQTFVPFSEFYKKLSASAPLKFESKQEILNKVIGIIKMSNTA